jgi:drug/metabolite transporter (DMT)-like permease
MISLTTTPLLSAVVKLAVAHGANSVETVFYRYAFAVPLVAGWALAQGGTRAIRTDRPGSHFIRGLVGMLAMLGVFTTVSLLPLADATTILFTAPLLATALSTILLGEKVGRHRWFAIALGLTGMVVMIQPGGSHDLRLYGALIGLGAALLTALSTITIRQLGITQTPTNMLFWFTVTGTIATGAIMPFYAQSHDVTTWALLGVAALIGTTGQAATTCALRYAPVGLLAPFEYLQLLWAVLFGWLIWSDLPGPTTLAGAALIIAAGLYTLYREHLRRRVGVAEETALA